MFESRHAVPYLDAEPASAGTGCKVRRGRRRPCVAPKKATEMALNGLI
jgi:hypothetical protein